MNYSRCDWCHAALDLGTEYALIDDSDKCCMDCWNHYGIKELVELHGYQYVYTED